MEKLLVVIFLVLSIGSAVEISSKIDLDSDEECGDSISTNSDPVIIVIKNEPETPQESPRFRPFGSRSNSGASFNSRYPGNSIKTRNHYVSLRFKFIQLFKCKNHFFRVFQ